MGSNSFIDMAKRNGQQDGFDESVEHGVKILRPKYVAYSGPKPAFEDLAHDSLHEHGASYSGEIGMKLGNGLVSMGTAPTAEAALEMAHGFLIEDHPSIADKRGPTGYIEIETGEMGWCFFGYASS